MGRFKIQECIKPHLLDALFRLKSIYFHVSTFLDYNALASIKHSTTLKQFCQYVYYELLISFFQRQSLDLEAKKVLFNDQFRIDFWSPAPFYELGPAIILLRILTLSALLFQSLHIPFVWVATHNPTMGTVILRSFT